MAISARSQDVLLTIAVNFNTHASISIIQAEAKELSNLFTDGYREQVRFQVCDAARTTIPFVEHLGSMYGDGLCSCIVGWGVIWHMLLSWLAGRVYTASQQQLR